MHRKRIKVKEAHWHATGRIQFCLTHRVFLNVGNFTKNCISSFSWKFWNIYQQEPPFLNGNNELELSIGFVHFTRVLVISSLIANPRNSFIWPIGLSFKFDTHICIKLKKPELYLPSTEIWGRRGMAAILPQPLLMNTDYMYVLPETQKLATFQSKLPP